MPPNIPEIVALADRATNALAQSAPHHQERQANALRGIGYALTAYVMLEIRKQDRKEHGYE